MQRLASSPRLRSWLGSVPAGQQGVRPGLRVEQLEDRVVPSSSIPLSGFGWKPLGGTIIGANDSIPLPVAGMMSGVSPQAVPFDATNPGVVGPTDPADPRFAAFNTIYASAPGGGIWKTTDGSRTWTPLTDNLPVSTWGNIANRNLRTQTVASSPLNTNLVFAGLGEQFQDYGFAGRGILRSADGGATWTRIVGPGGAFDDAAVAKFVFHPTDANIVYTIVNGFVSDYFNAQPSSGVYRSTDAGVTWESVVQTIPGAAGGTISDFIIDPTNPSITYVALVDVGQAQQGVYRGSNSQGPANAISYEIVLGGSGTLVPGGSLQWVKLAFGLGTPSQPSRIYALSASGPIEGNSNQLFRSDDSGINFRRLDPLPVFTSEYSRTWMHLLPDPTNPSRIFVGGSGAGSLQVLTNADYNPDAGELPNWINFTPSSDFRTTFQSVQSMVFDTDVPKDVNGRPLNPGRLTIATDAGLFRLQAPGGAQTTIDNYISNSLEFVSLNGNVGPNALNVQQFFSTAVPPRDDNVTLGGTLFNGQAIYLDLGPFNPNSPDAKIVTSYNNLYGWSAPQGPPGVRGTGGQIVYSQINPNLVYRVSNLTQEPNQNVNQADLVQFSTDGGLTWQTGGAGIVTPDILVNPTRAQAPFQALPTSRFAPAGAYQVPFIADPSPQIGSAEARLFLGTTVVNQSTDGGRTFTQYGPDLPYATPDVPTNPDFRPRPRVTAIGRGRSQQLVTYAAVDWRYNNEIAYGPAIYRYLEPPLGPSNPEVWTDASPGVFNRLLPPSMGAPTEPQPNTLQDNLFTGVVLQLIVDPVDINIVYAITTNTGPGRIIRTADGGNSWADLTGNLPGASGGSPGLSVFTIAQDPNRLFIQPGNLNSGAFQEDDDIYIGTTNGVWKLTNPTGLGPFVWTRFGGGADGTTPVGTDRVAGALPDVYVMDIDLNTTTGVLSAATFGRGIWQYQIRSYIRGQVYSDVNGNGVQDGPDGLLGNAVVVAINNGTVPPSQFANTTTAANGEYVFRSLPTGNYTFIPANASTAYVDPATKYFFTSNPITSDVDPTTTLNGQDLFVFERISISGQAYIDANGNGVRDNGEGPAAGYEITLVAPAGTLAATPTVLATVTTNAQGSYTFFGVGPLRNPATGPGPQLASGYQVVLSKLGFLTTETPSPTGPLTAAVNLTDATNQGQTRIGVFQVGQLSGSVFNDMNGDGVRQPGEPGLAGFTVELIDTATGAVVSSVVTPTTGNYTFGDLLTSLGAGNFQINVVPQPGFVQTTPPITQPVVSGTNTTGLNVGQFAAASIFGVVFEDVNGNGVRDAGEDAVVPGLTVALVNGATGVVLGTAAVDPLGRYNFGNLFPLQLPGNTVPFLIRLIDPAGQYTQTSIDPAVILTSGQTTTASDLGVFVNTQVSGFAFEDLNGDGIRQPGEPGLAGGPVALINVATGAVVFSTVTDSAGNFLFPSVGPVGGAVQLRVGAAEIGAFQTTPNPANFVLSSGVPVGGFVIGLFRAAPFTGTVFNDLNGNGVRDAGEPGLAGIGIRAADPNGNLAFAVATTDPEGNYTLLVGPGTYRAVQLLPAGVIQTTPANPVFTPTSGQVVPGQNFGDFLLNAVTGRVFEDLNGDGSGAGDPPFAGVTVELLNSAGVLVASVITDAAGNYTLPNIAPGGYTVRVVGVAGTVASTPVARTYTAISGQSGVFDFGFFRTTTAGGLVFEDLDRTGTQTPGDIPLAGIAAQLLNSAGNVIAAAATDPSGRFTFPAVSPGTYTLRVLPPEGFIAITPAVQTVSITSGQPFTAAPVALLRLGSVAGTVFLDPNRNNRLDAAERGLAGGVVALTNAAGVRLATQTTGPTGTYAFFGLEAGTYTVTLLSAPSGFQPTAVGGDVRTVAVTIGSPNPNTAAIVDFGLTGRKRYAIAAGQGGGPRVQVYDALSNSLLQDFFVYEETFTGGVRATMADVNGDGTEDLIVVPGFGGGPRVRVLDGVTGAVIYDYFAYEPEYRGGLYVAAGDVNGDGFADLITGTESGGGPRVTVYSGKTGTVLNDFFAYDPDFRGGVRIGAGDVTGDGIADVITAPGIGGGPVVRVWAGPTLTPTASFLAYPDNYTGGTYVAAAPTGPGGRSNILVGTGLLQPSAGVALPVVRVFAPGTNALSAEIEAFPAGLDPAGYKSEVRVASFDRNGDGVPDIALANGPNSYPRVRFLDGTNRRQLGEEQQPFEFGFTGGIFIG